MVPTVEGRGRLWRQRFPLNISRSSAVTAETGTRRLVAPHLSHSLSPVAGLLAAPYGYTVSLWAAGAAATAHFGPPTVWEILIFASGAVSGFLLLAAWGRRGVGRQVPESVPPVILANAVPILPAVLVSEACTLLPWPLVGFGFSGFLVTLTYGLGLAALLTFGPHLWNRSSPSKRASRHGSPVWLFDLDNTLYPPDAGLMDALTARINRFIERRLHLAPEVARAVRQAYFGRYGSSVVGVIRHCQVDPAEFLASVHDLDVEEYLSPDAELDALLGSLPGDKYVFTNAPADYARRTLRALGVEHHFKAIFDIYDSGLEGKASPASYERVLSTLGHPADICWFVEDNVANLMPARALGCHTVWLAPDGAAPPPYVEHVIRTLDELRRLGTTTSGATAHRMGPAR